MQRSNPEPSNEPAEATAESRRVVLVEDSEDLRSLLSELLAFCGHEVRVAGCGREGIELIESCRPDVALVDIGLPDIDGYEVARRLRAGPLAQSVQLVAVTGRSDAQDRQDAMAAGFNEHLVKPVDLARLAALLNATPPLV